LKAIVEDGKLYGWSSNDAGGLVGLLLSIYAAENLPYNIVSGFSRRKAAVKGLNSVLKAFPS
jgi:hypothetical protein